MSQKPLTGLDIFLRKYPSHSEYLEFWPSEGQMLVRLALTSELPPKAVRSSILSIVIQAPSRVLWLYPDEESSAFHQLLIGGRPKGGETPEETVIREVKEETGWLCSPVALIGFRHFHQTKPRSDQSDRPYPDFIQPIFASLAVSQQPRAILPKDFIPNRMIEWAELKSKLSSEQHPLLLVAIQAMSRRP